MKQYYWLFLTFIFLSPSIYAQRFFEVEIVQAAPIQLDPGAATIICSGSEVALGGTPTASGGYGQLLYYWSPADKLDNPNSPNPIAQIVSPTMFTLLVVDEKGCSKQDYIKVATDLCTGIQELLDLEALSVFPNPASERLYIQSSGATHTGETKLKLFNCFGQLVKEETIDQSYSDDPFEWGIQNLLPGLYIIQMSRGENSKIEKIQIY